MVKGGRHEALPSGDEEEGADSCVAAGATTTPTPTPTATTNRSTSSRSATAPHSDSSRPQLHSMPSPTSATTPSSSSAGAAASASLESSSAMSSTQAFVAANSTTTTTANLHEQWQDQIDQTIRPAIHNFFYPRHRRRRRELVDSSDDDDDVIVEVVDGGRGRGGRGFSPDRSAREGAGVFRSGSGGGGAPSSLAAGPESSSPHGVASSSTAGEQGQPYAGGDGVGRSSPPPSTPAFTPDGGGGAPDRHPHHHGEERQQGKQDRRFVEHFWRTYDDIIILSLFTQLGILFRLGMATYFTFFDSVFSNDSALFENLPLNCLSCFIMGTLCSGERLMEIVSTRFTPSRLQHDVVRDGENDDEDDGEEDGDEDDEESGNQNGVSSPHSGSGAGSPPAVRSPGSRQASLDSSSPMSPGNLRQRRRRLLGPGNLLSAVTAGRNRGDRRSKRQRSSSYFHSWQPPVHLDAELREVQLLALERRIRASKCLLLFPVRKEDFDLMEHYFESGYKRKKQSRIVVDGPSGSLDGHDDDDDDDSTDQDRPSSYARNANDLSYDLELQVELVGGREGSGARDPVDGTDRRHGDPLAHRDGDTDRRVERHVAFDDTPSINSRSTQHRAREEQHGRTASSDAGESPMITVALDEATPSTSSPSAQGIGRAEPGSSRTLTASRGGSGAGEGEGTSAGASEAAPTAATDADDNLMVEEFFQDMHANVTENLSRLQRVNLADGWDVGTTPDDMSDDLMLGLRDGFCGALSSFSSWNSAMVGLMRSDRIGDAFVGYMLGIQLPIIAYRFGQHVAVYVFIWRCRFETRRDERRGYGIRLSMNEVSERDSDDEGDGQNGDSNVQPDNGDEASERKIPSVRAVATALFVLAIVTQCTSLSFFNDPEKQLIALSLLFSPLGVLARWRLSRLNSWRPTFPLGTFTSNIVACLLSGSLGQLLAGNPGPKERIVLVSIISGFGGTLSSLAAFVVEVLAGIDPVLFRFDGFFYACSSIFWAWLVGFLFSSTADWADQTSQG